jgi:hypothetical protein
MPVPLPEAVANITRFRKSNPNATKDDVAKAAAASCGLRKVGKVYACDEYAIRFSTANTPGFNGTVLGLRKLQQFDDIPFVVVVCRPRSTDFLLANTTMLKKISLAAHQLRVDNIRGSFNGSDIHCEYDGVVNSPENFPELFARHQEFTWQENLERLVEATNNIAGTGHRFEPTDADRTTILAAPSLASDIVGRPSYVTLKQELARIVEEKSARILKVAERHRNNVNQRGNEVEQLITDGKNEHNLGDMVRHIDGDITLEVEIKTKLMDRTSSPKAYNIDKALQTLACPKTLIVFCFVGIDLACKRTTTSTVSILDSTVIRATRKQFHWAGRNSRGVTQLTGDLAPLFSPEFEETIDQGAAVEFLEDLINL